MSTRRSIPLILILTIFLLTACQAAIPENASEPASTGQESSGPTGVISGPFQAAAASATSVSLSWDPVEGATGYRIENSFADSRWFTIAELGGEAASFEDFPAPSDTELHYRLTPLMGEQEGKAFELTVTTPEIVPNPLTVVVTLEEPDYSSIGIDLTGFDPATFDPSTFDPSSVDLTAIDPAELDMASLLPEPVSAMAWIGPEGGSLSVTGENGVTYTLEIPPDAIDFSTYYVLTPVASIEGFPFSGGFFGAVQIQPEGIVFDIPVTLTIDIPEELRLAAQQLGVDALPVAFAYHQSGEEFHLTPYELVDGAQSSAVLAGKGASPNQQSGGSGMSVGMNSTQSVGAGGATGAEIRSQGDRTPNNRSDAADQKQALDDLSDQELDEYYKDKEQKEKEKAKKEQAERRALEIAEAIYNSKSLKQLTDAIREFELFYKTSYLYIAPDVEQAMMDLAGGRLRVYVKPVDCPYEDAGLILMWAQRLIKPKTPFDIELKRTFSGGDISAADAKLESIIAGQGCLLRLELSSRMQLSDWNNSCSWELVVFANVPLSWKYAGSSAILQGGASGGKPNLIYQLPIPVHSDSKKPGYCDMVEYENIDESDFTVIKMWPSFSSDGLTVKDWELVVYRPGGDVDELTITFKDPPPVRDEWTETKPIRTSGIADPWGGGMGLIESSGKGTSDPGKLGLKNWTIYSLDSKPYLAKWQGSGLFTDNENRFEHKSTIFIYPK